jgi:cyclopropane-fatty-acyl-phospholipid synthase
MRALQVHLSGGYSPALSEVLAAVEKPGLWVTDLEIWRLHYASTLRHWRERFLRNRAQIAHLYDERSCRMWGFYPAASGSRLSRKPMASMLGNARNSDRLTGGTYERDRYQ